RHIAAAQHDRGQQRRHTGLNDARQHGVDAVDLERDVRMDFRMDEHGIGRAADVEAVRQHHEPLAFELLQVDVLALRVRARARNDQRKRLRNETLVANIRRVVRHEPETEIEPPRLDLRLDAARSELMDADRHAGIGARHFAEHRRHPREMKRRNHTDIDAPHDEAGNVVDGAARSVELAEHDLGALTKGRARLRKKHALADALEQRSAQRRLELRDLLGNARLRNPQALRRAREILGLGDGQKIPQMSNLDLVHGQVDSVKLLRYALELVKANSLYQCRQSASDRID